MGAVCGNSNKRIVPKTKKATLGLRSGQTIDSQSVFQQALHRKEETKQINPLQIQEEDLVNWDDPNKVLISLFKGKNYRVVKILKTTTNSITAEIVDVTSNQSLIFKRNLFDNFDNASNNISYLYNLNKVSTEGLLHFTSLTISHFDQSHLQIKQDKTLYAIDRIIPKYSNLQEQLQSVKLESLMQSLLILEQISECLTAMHNEKYAYRFLRPESVLTRDQKKFLLSNPSIQRNQKEQKIIQLVVAQENDYYIYDVVMFAMLFLYLVDHEKYSFDQLIDMRTNEEEWGKVLASYREVINLQFQNDVPQMIIQLINELTQFDKYCLSSMKDIYQQIKSCRQKGMQTYFKNDSLGAYLQYHRDKKLSHVSPWMYFAKANQLHLFNLESNKFHYLKVFRKKSPFKIESEVVYHPIDDKFFFFSNNQSSFLLKVYDEAHDKESISQRREVELFRNMKQLKFDEPQILVITDSETDSKIYIMNQQQLTDDATQDVYYTSYLITFQEQMVENIIDDDADLYQKVQDRFVNKKVVRIMQGPKNYQWHRTAYHFYDPHNHFIYCIPDYNNVFQNGIRYSYFDVSRDKGNFKEGLLRFACSTEEIFKQFCQLNLKIKHIVFCVEVQHGVFLMQASKNIFILDFNFKCFYTLASLTQLQKFQQNNKLNPDQYANAYETRNQPFQLKCLDAGGHNFTFQNGYLHCLARKEIETVHCIYDIIPNQGCVVLLHCFSLHSNNDLLLFIPKSLDMVVSAQQQMIEQSQSKRYIKHIRQYGCIKYLFQDSEEAYLSAENENKQRFYLHQVKASNLGEISLLFQAFNKKIISDQLLTPIEYFASYEEKSFQMNYVNEDITMTMDSEIENRRLNKNPFEPKELALLVRIIFRTLKELKDNNLEHGNLQTNSLCFTKKGIIKISGWYVANRKNFSSDLDDALKLIYCLATLNRYQEVEQMDLTHPSLPHYEGLLEFIRQVQLHTKNLPYQNILNQANSLSRTLMTQNIDFNNIMSKAQAIMWVGYGNNYIVITPLENLKEPRFIKLSLLKANNTPYKLSKHCMFTFNHVDTLYIAGANKDDLKTQQFYEVLYNKNKTNQILPIKKLNDIPFPVLSPTLLYAEDKVYSIGGYELGKHMNKQITDKFFCYNVKTKQWRELKNLPITLYGSTSLFCPEKQIIYLFGGVSNEIDLTSDKLIYLTYELQKDHWEFNVDLSYKSPFQNSRFSKPIVDIISPKLFVSYYKTEDGYFFVEIFELVKAGISMKYRIKDSEYIERKENDLDLYADQFAKEYRRTLQDDMSMAMYKDSVYVMDEDTMSLRIFRLKDPFNPQQDVIPCLIQENPVLAQRVYSQENII